MTGFEFVAVFAGVATISVAISKGWEYLQGNTAEQILDKMDIRCFERREQCVDGISTKIDNLGKELNDKIDKVIFHVAKINGDVGELKSDVCNLKDTVGELKSDVSNLKDTVNRIESNGNSK